MGAAQAPPAVWMLRSKYPTCSTSELRPEKSLCYIKQQLCSLVHKMQPQPQGRHRQVQKSFYPQITQFLNKDAYGGLQAALDHNIVRQKSSSRSLVTHISSSHFSHTSYIQLCFVIYTLFRISNKKHIGQGT